MSLQSYMLAERQKYRSHAAMAEQIKTRVPTMDYRTVQAMLAGTHRAMQPERLTAIIEALGTPLDEALAEIYRVDTDEDRERAAAANYPQVGPASDVRAKAQKGKKPSRRTAPTAPTPPAASPSPRAGMPVLTRASSETFS